MITVNNYYEKRYLSESGSIDEMNKMSGFIVSKSLEELVLEHKKIVLLGDPGMGKTRELFNLFEILWDKKNETNLIPISINLKNFRRNSDFEDLIKYKDWKTLPNVIFILDGLDEIAEIQDFISAFEIFLTKNDSSNAKYVISCRTNIFNKYLVNISNFKTYLLNDLTTQQALSILNNQFDIDIIDSEIEISQTPFFQTPFFLELIAEFYKSNKRLPDTEKEAWELYVNKTIDEQKEKDIKKRILNKPLLKKNLQRVALFNELRQNNFISETELFEVLGEKSLEFIENPFFETIETNSDSWGFSHRQIQEYFVANTLSKLEFNKLLDIIKIPNSNSIYPSLFNVVSFLINIHKNKKTLTQLIDWLIENDIEVIIKADSNRISNDLKTTVFQRFFNKQCIENKLWIDTNSSISIEELGKFGNCEVNFNYLLKIIQNSTEHFRTRISAIILISQFELFDKTNLIKTYFEILEDTKGNKSEKSNLIRSLINLNLHNEDNNKLLNRIFDVFENETNNEINRSLLELLVNLPHIDKYYIYIKKEFLRANKINTRNDDDNVIRGNSYILNELIFKFNNPYYFLEFASYYCIDYNISYSEEMKNSIIRKFISFPKGKTNYVIDFIAIIDKNKNDHKRIDEEFLSHIITSCNVNFEVFTFLLNEDTFSEQKWLLASISNAACIELLLQKIKNGFHISDNHLQGFRNILSNYSFELAKQFELEIINSGFEFKNILKNKDEWEEVKRELLSQKQENFNLIFEKNKFIERIQDFYKKHDLDKLNRGELFSIEREFYNEKENPYYDPNKEIKFLYFVINKKNTITVKDVKDALDNNSIFIHFIRKCIEENSHSTIKVKLNNHQKEQIKTWLLEASRKIEFDMIIKYNSSSSFEFKSREGKAYYDLIKTIFYFIESEDFQINLEKNILIQLIEFFQLEDYDDFSEKFKSFLLSISETSLVNEQIEKNIKNGLFSFSAGRHFVYALENDLKSTYKYIRDYFKSNNAIYPNDDLFELYMSKTNDVKLLKEHCFDMSTISSWTCLEMLIGTDDELVIDKSIAYLSNGGKEHEKKALKLLFRLNNEDAIIYYLKIFKQDIIQGFSNNNYLHYDQLKSNDYSILKELFYLVYTDNNDRFEFSSNQSFIRSYISNLASKEIHYLNIKQLFSSIKVDLQENVLNDSMYFHINLLIDVANKSYVNAMSAPMNFNLALIKSKEIINQT